MWGFMVSSWVTPTSLFIFLNLMIGIIVLTSRFGTHRNPQGPQQHQQQQEQLGPYDSHQLVRTPSLLERVRSINFSFYNYEQPNPENESLQYHPTGPDYVTQHDHQSPDNPTGLARTPSLLERLKSMDLSSFYRSEQPNPHESEHEARDPKPKRENLVHRSKSDSGGGSPEHQSDKMKKSVSEKSELGEFEENDGVRCRRPAAARVEKTASFGGDEGVDAKADDFINRFKQQLKLQRLDSLLRYKRNA